LLDAPCSATGVIRRHPDIKWLRRDRDIAELAQLQAEILNATWLHLNLAARWFMQRALSCQKKTSSKLPPSWHARRMRFKRNRYAEKPGRQNLPGAEDGDGFFYAKLIKK
jgi:16S rRNA (cytosine967-C5)-methyltransferase